MAKTIYNNMVTANKPRKSLLLANQHSNVFILIKLYMSINLNISFKGAETPVSITVSRQSILSVITSDTLELALEKRYFSQKFIDLFARLFNYTSHKEVITNLFNELHKIEGTKNTLTLSNRILNLAKKAENEGNFQEFRDALKLNIKKSGGTYLVTVSLSDTHFAEMEFNSKEDLEDRLDKDIFEATTNLHEYKLTDNCLEKATVTRLAALNPTRQYQVNKEALKAQKDNMGDFCILDSDFSRPMDLSEKTCDQIRKDLHRQLNFLKNNSDANSLNKETYKKGVLADFEPVLVKNLNESENKLYAKFKNLSDEQQSLVHQIINEDVARTEQTDRPVNAFIRSFKRYKVKETENNSLNDIIAFKTTLEFPETRKDDFKSALEGLPENRKKFHLICTFQEVNNAFVGQVAAAFKNISFSADGRITCDFERKNSVSRYYVDDNNPDTFRIETDIEFRHFDDMENKKPSVFRLSASATFTIEQPAKANKNTDNQLAFQFKSVETIKKIEILNPDGTVTRRPKNNNMHLETRKQSDLARAAFSGMAG